MKRHSHIAVGLVALGLVATGVGYSVAATTQSGPSQLVRTDVSPSQIVRTDGEGKTYGSVTFDSQNRPIAPDFIATDLPGGGTGYISRAEVFAGPPVTPDGQPTGASVDMTVRDINGHIIGKLQHGGGQPSGDLVKPTIPK